MTSPIFLRKKVFNFLQKDYQKLLQSLHFDIEDIYFIKMIFPMMPCGFSLLSVVVPRT